VIRNRTFRRCCFDEAAEAIEIPGLTPHQLRHTCASLAVSVKAVQLMLGHASAAITLDVYADLFEDDLDVVGRALNEAATALAPQTVTVTEWQAKTTPTPLASLEPR
jgi:integrase